MVRLLFFVLFFILAPFGKANANSEVQNCAVLNTPSHQQKTDEIAVQAHSGAQKDFVVFVQADTDTDPDIDTLNDKQPSFTILPDTDICYDTLWIVLIRAAQKPDTFTSVIPVVLPAKYLLYHQLKIPFSTL